MSTTMQVSVTPGLCGLSDPHDQQQGVPEKHESTTRLNALACPGLLPAARGPINQPPTAVSAVTGAVTGAGAAFSNLLYHGRSAGTGPGASGQAAGGGGFSTGATYLPLPPHQQAPAMGTPVVGGDHGAGVWGAQPQQQQGGGQGQRRGGLMGLLGFGRR